MDTGAPKAKAKARRIGKAPPALLLFAVPGLVDAQARLAREETSAGGSWETVKSLVSSCSCKRVSRGSLPRTEVPHAWLEL